MNHRGIMAGIIATHWLDIDWTDPECETVDGFTVAEINEFVHESIIEAACSTCGERHNVEPDARGYNCWACGERGTVTSPLIKLGLL